jgi:hypothetical protein
MTVDLGEDKKETLDVYEGDNPFELAKKFCFKHSLTAEAVDILAMNIIHNRD